MSEFCCTASQIDSQRQLKPLKNLLYNSKFHSIHPIDKTIMSISRFASFALARRSRGSLNLLQGLSSCRRSQLRNFSDAPRYNTKKMNALYSEKPLGEKLWSWAKYIVPAGLLLVAGTGILVHQNDEKRAISKGQGKDRARGENTFGPKIGGPFTLFDTEHRRITERDLSGNWVLLYFGYTSSPDVGPEEVQKMAKALKILDSKPNVKLLPIFVTIDPQRDSPSQLRAYLKEFDHRIVGLTGPISAIRQMAQEYRVYFKKVDEDGNDYLVDSSHKMYLLQPNTEVVRCFGPEYDADKLSLEITREMSKTSI